MRIELIKAKDLKTARWAGGTTTQLAIYPPGTEYQKFNFTFRVSYATVEVPSSTFTFMPGVMRHLMILEGNLKIDHADRYKKVLAPFEQDVFDGEWPTTAEGMVKDFNLMTRNDAEGELKSLHLKSDQQEKYHFRDKVNYAGIYLQHGSVSLEFDDTLIELEKGDFLFVDFSGKASRDISIIANTQCDIIIAEVKV